MAPIRNAASYSAVVFDLDGTLVRLPVRWRAAADELEALFGTDKVLNPVFGLLAKLLQEKPWLREQAFSILDRYELESLPSAEPVAGSVDLVKSLHGKTRLCLVTMQGRRPCEAALDRLGLRQLFGAIVTREVTLQRSQQLLTALSRVGGAPHSSLFVADLPNDAAAAQEAEVELALIGGHDIDGIEPGHRFSDCAALWSSLSS